MNNSGCKFYSEMGDKDVSYDEEYEKQVKEIIKSIKGSKQYQLNIYNKK